jgi:hypothetical protein
MKWKNTVLVGIYKCEMSYSSKGGGLQCEWSPDLPDRPLTEQEYSQYRAGRDNILSKVAKHLGGNILVVEI